jgi:peptidoglycan/xylan/chitin deacetylase (PgdA/CDA1 family)
MRARQTVGRALAHTIHRRPQPGTLTILMYHAVTADRVEESGQMSVSAADFERQLTELQSTGVTVVDLGRGVADLAAGQLRHPSAAIVFDDGFVGVHDFAAPALARRRWPSTVFVTTSWVGLPTMPLADERLGRPLTWREIVSLQMAGVAVGSHTHTHRALATLSEADVDDELRRSSALIADAVGSVPATFAYPFGAFGTFDERTRDVAAAAGFTAGCTTVFGRNTSRSDPLALHRIRVSWCDGPGEIAAMLSGSYDWYRWVQRAQSRMRSHR